MKQKNIPIKYFILILVIATLLTSSITYSLVSASLPTVIIGPGMNTSDYAYIIFKSGSIYYAKNGVTGSIDYSGTNASSVSDSALLLSVGHTVYFKGDFTVTHFITIPNDVKIILDGTITLANNINTAIFRNTHWGAPVIDYGIYITGGLLVGNKAGQTVEANDGAISLRGVQNCTVENVEVRNFWGFAGIYIAGGYNHVSHNLVTGSKLTTAHYGSGIYITGNPLCDYNTITFNTCIGNQGDGILIEDYTNYNYIAGNTVKQNSGTGICLIYSNATTVTGNKVYGNGASGNYGIEILGYFNSITDNTVENVQYAAIKIYNSNNTVISNKIFTPLVSAYGIHVEQSGNKIIANQVIATSFQYSIVAGNIDEFNS